MDWVLWSCVVGCARLCVQTCQRLLVAAPLQHACCPSGFSCPCTAPHPNQASVKPFVDDRAMRDKKRAIDKFVTLNVQQISATLEQVRFTRQRLNQPKVLNRNSTSESGK